MDSVGVTATPVSTTADLQQQYHQQFGNVLPLLLPHQQQESMINPTTSAFRFRHQQHELAGVSPNNDGATSAAMNAAAAISVNSIYNTLTSLSAANYQQNVFVDGVSPYATDNAIKHNVNFSLPFDVGNTNAYSVQHQQIPALLPEPIDSNTQQEQQRAALQSVLRSNIKQFGHRSFREELQQQQHQLSLPAHDAGGASRSTTSTSSSRNSGTDNEKTIKRRKSPPVECVGSRNNCWLIKHYEVDREVYDGTENAALDSKALAAKAVDVHFRKALAAASAQTKVRPMNQRRLPASFFIKPKPASTTAVEATAAATAAAAAAAAALQRTFASPQNNTGSHRNSHHHHHQHHSHQHHLQQQQQQSANVFSHHAAAAAAAAALEAAHYNPTQYNSYYYSTMSQNHNHQQATAAAAAYAAQQSALGNFMSASSAMGSTAADFAASLGSGIASQYANVGAPVQQQQQQQAAAVADAYSAYGALACNSTFYNTQAAALAAAAHASYHQQQQHHHRNGISTADPWTMYAASAYTTATPALSAVPSSIPVHNNSQQLPPQQHAFQCNRQHSQSYSSMISKVQQTTWMNVNNYDRQKREI